jgi:TPP-dependent pyruvate/acetoin dehydrogenase alpha subunit
MGKRDGLGHGKGGSMHVAEIDKGMLGANGIVVLPSYRLNRNLLR